MLRRSSLFSLALLTVAWSNSEAACSNTWTATGSQSWNVPANWGGGCVPGATPPGDIANFSENTAGLHTIALDDGVGTAFNPSLKELLVPNTTTYLFIPSIFPPQGIIIFNDPNGLLQCSNANITTFSCALSAAQNLTINTTGQTQLTFDSGSSLINTPGTNITISNQSTPVGMYPISIDSPGVGFASSGMVLLNLTQGLIENSGITGTNATAITVGGTSVIFNNTTSGQFGLLATQITIDTGATVTNSGSAQIGNQAATLTFKGTSNTSNTATTSLIGPMCGTLNVQDNAVIQNAGAFGVGASNITFSGFGSLTSTSPNASFGGAASVVTFNGNSVLTGTTASDVKLVSADAFTINNNASVLVSQISIVNALTVNDAGQFNVSNAGGGTASAVTGNVSQTGGTITSINVNNIGAATVGTAFVVNNAPGIVMSNGVFTIQNNGIVSGAGAVGSQMNDLSDLSISGGTFNVIQNTSAVSSGGTGAQLHVSGSGILSGGVLNFTNNGSNSLATTAAVEGLFNTLSLSQSAQMNLTNNGTVTGGAAAAAGVQLTVTGTFSQTGTTSVTNTNTNSINLGTGSAIIVGGATSFSGGTGSSFSSTNSGTLSSASSIGTSFLSTGAITLGGTKVTLANSGTINAALGPAIGTLMTSPSIVGSGSDLILTNTGTISGSTTNLGTALQTSGNIALGSGAWSATNSGTVVAGNGIQLKTAGNFSITGGSLSLNNIGSVSGTSTGTRLIVGNAFNVSGGTASVGNASAVTSPAFGAGIQVNGPITLSSGAISVTSRGSYVQSQTGAINISGGVFTNNGITATPLGVNLSGGVLQSNGGIFQADPIAGGNTIVTNSGGNFVPGVLDPAVGTTNIVGTYTQNAGTFTLVIGNLTTPTPGVTHSFLVDTGTGVVNLNGGNLNVLPVTGLNLFTDIPAGPVSLQFIQAANIINGGFTPVNPANPITFDPLISPFVSNARYETIAGNQGWLFFTFTPPSITPRTNPISNQAITVSTINHINTFLWRRLIEIQFGKISYTEECIPQLSASNIEMEKRKQMMASPLFASASPLLGFARYRPKVETKQQQQQQLTIEIAEPRTTRPWNAYVGPLGDFGKIHSRHREIGCNFHYVGGLAGFDYAFSEVGTGVMVDYEHVTADLHKHAGKFWVDQFHVNSYTTYIPKSLPEIVLNGILGAGGSWYDVHRNASESPKETAHAKTKGAQFDALIGTQYIFGHQKFKRIPTNLKIIPMLNLQYIYQGIASYKEHGAGLFNLKFSSQRFKSLRSTLGAWLQYTWTRNHFSFTPLFNIAWQREYLDRKHHIRATPITIAGPTQNLPIYGAGRNTLLTGLDFLFQFYEIYGLEVSYDFEYNNFYNNNTFYLGFKINF